MAAVKLDENMPASVGAILQEGGHDVAFARDENELGFKKTGLVHLHRLWERAR